MPRYWLVTTPHYHPASVNRRGDGWPKPVSQSRVVLRVVGIEFLFFSSFSSSFFFFSSSSPPPPLGSPRLLRFLSLVNACINSVQSARARWNRANRDRIVVVLRGKRAAFSSSLSFFSSPPSGRGGRREKSWWIFTRRGMVVRVGGRGESGSWQDSFTVPASR